MLKENLNYSGKNVYVGIDVHKKNYAVSVICDGVVVKKFSQIAEPEQLAVALKKWFGEASLFSVYEAHANRYGAGRMHGRHRL